MLRSIYDSKADEIRITFNQLDLYAIRDLFAIADVPEDVTSEINEWCNKQINRLDEVGVEEMELKAFL